MKPINLISLINAKENLEETIFDSYANNFNIQIKDQEIVDLKSLTKELLSEFKSLSVTEGFYIGFIINQIGKEFDLLRFGENTIINIELKKVNTGIKMKEQLIKNKYYLGFSGKEVLNFTYVAADKKVYYLDTNEDFKEVEISFLVEKLKKQKLKDIGDIHKFFNPSNYLVSPFNSTEDFIAGRYFLTEHQGNVKKQILKLSASTGPNFISVEGYAGTGKTLLTYDIAKEYRNQSKRVLIFHCGTLNDGHRKLVNKHNWTIAPVKNYRLYNLKNYDLLIFDEVQRINKNQLEKLFPMIEETTLKCVFSYDPAQCLAKWETDNNIPEFIKQQVSPTHFKLTDKIRTNKELAAFIKNLFDLSKRDSNQDYSNVDIHYFKTYDGARRYMEILKEQDWKIIRYTPSQYYNYPYDKYQSSDDESAHNVVGQEYDNVVAVIDEYFFYNEDGKLTTKEIDYYYDVTKMLFQMVTRARKKLRIIIINNQEVLQKCLGILNLNK
ncbi:ATP-binding protein [Bacillus cereus]|uniref:ATP-binding protein n=1 Tax=Bacillus cereus TaxID=1396 RepID=UPI000B4A7718|nr:ATP-binding protein [Bacillus cereus]